MGVEASRTAYSIGIINLDVFSTGKNLKDNELAIIITCDGCID